MENTLYYGDNLKILREYIKDNSIDLIYLDPPFKSGKDYNILFKEPNGLKSEAQIQAFEDTWHWNEVSENTYFELINNAPIKLTELLKSFRNFLGENDMMAYLTMMSIRLIELKRVLKETGSIYLHCDSTASHYLKILMDIIFNNNFKNEIIWNYGRGASNIKSALPKGHETILFYTKSNDSYWNPPKRPYSEKLIRLLKKDEKGYYYTRGRRTGRREIAEWEKNTKAGLKTYVDLETGGTKCTDVWDDLGGYPSSAEGLGYQTQKPISLLKRIIMESSRENDLILDPFCGCGTTIDSAIELKRNWIGIDITHLAISLIKYRIENRYGSSINYKVVGEPEDLKGAFELSKNDRYQFQWWALSLVKARPANEDMKKGADHGIDGIKYFQDSPNKNDIKKIVIQVKSGYVSVKDIRELITVKNTNDASIGILITLNNPTEIMIKESLHEGFYINFYGKKYPKIQILTIDELLKGNNIEYFNISDITFKVAEKHIDKLFK